MLFNSYFFTLVFFPTAFAGFFLLNGFKLTIASRVWLATASLFFYAWWNPAFLPLILISIAFNYALGVSMRRLSAGARRRTLLIIGIGSNLMLLGYFKYCNFFIGNIDQLLALKFPVLNVVLPLGISFFTFTQIAYLADAYSGLAKEYSLLNYVLFVTFFPHLIAGPIIHHKEMMPQFDSPRNKLLQCKNIFTGGFLFSMGLFKKLILADTFGLWANYGFNEMRHLTMVEAWVVSLSYTFQIYFDFSGYTDMALGSALFFNIKLPANFNSPYKAPDMREFWRRWHMTLSRFFRDYVYIPLGGSRVGRSRECFNVLITFILGGLWHGAGWLFILWGLLHGLANAACRFLGDVKVKQGSFAFWSRWFITFNFINLTWVLFRAKDLKIAGNIIASMFDLSHSGVEIFKVPPVILHDHWFEFGWKLPGSTVDSFAFAFIAAGFILTLGFKNSNHIAAMVLPSCRWAAVTGLLFGISMVFMSRRSEFLYFQF